MSKIFVLTLLEWFVHVTIDFSCVQWPQYDVMKWMPHGIFLILNFVDDDTDTPISARAVDKLSMVWNGNCDLMYCVFLFSYMIIPQNRSEYSCRMLQSPMQVVRWCSQKYPLNVLTVFSSIRNTKIRRLALKPFRPFSVMLSMLLNPYCFFGTKFRQF